MPEIAVAPFVMKDAIVQIVADDFAAACSSVALNPTSSTVTFKGLKPGAVFTDVSQATWALALTFAQDWVTPGSLSRYLFANEGQTKAAVIKPQSGVGPSFNVNIVITPGAVGGAGEQVATATVTLGVSGRPELVDDED
jgi:hypothetical protein